MCVSCWVACCCCRCAAGPRQLLLLLLPRGLGGQGALCVSCWLFCCCCQCAARPRKLLLLLPTCLGGLGALWMSCWLVGWFAAVANVLLAQLSHVCCCWCACACCCMGCMHRPASSLHACRHCCWRRPPMHAAAGVPMSADVCHTVWCLCADLPAACIRG